MLTEKELLRILSYWPLPACVIDQGGIIRGAMKSFVDIMEEDDLVGKELSKIMEMKHKTICQGGVEKPVKYCHKESVYKVIARPLQEEDGPYTIVSLRDITTLENLKVLYNEARDAIAVLNIDNYEELIQGTSEENRGSLLSALDKTIRSWGGKMDASVTKIGENKYLVVFSQQYLEGLSEGKYAILDEVRAIETETDFPATLSIGVGSGGKTPAQTEKYASDMLDLALGRGGDQAVVKKINKVEYYGGKSQAVEKTNKGKSRVVAHALTTLLNQSSKVFIMGHRNPDMDSFGAALGLFRMCDSRYSEAYILLEKYNDTLAEMVHLAQETDSYNFVTGEEALQLADKDSLLILVDFHRPMLAESPQLLEKIERVAIIDHHRKAADCVENPVLQYLEPYASSTSELVAEILGYSGERKNIDKLEAEIMLAGITMDTNRFSVKTGVRTFEAAAWLKRQGADTTEVKRFFQTDMKLFKIRAKCVSKATITKDGQAMTICEGEHNNAQIITAQIADELLSVKGVKAGYVAARDIQGGTVMSARSLGAVNVQTVMEKLGGGGHLTTAGCQSKETPEELIKKLKAVLREDEE